MPRAIAPDRKHAADVDSDDIPLPQLDYAPESICLSKDAEFDWLDQNAFIERKNSAKASNTTNPNSNPNLIYGSNRHSASLKSFFGLPKARKPNYAEAKNRRVTKPASIQLFPNRSGSVGRKPTAALCEPSSPKVSCMGRVRSRRDRKKQAESDVTIKKRKTGFWNNFRSIFRPGGSKRNRPDGEPAVPDRKGLSEMKKCSELNRFTSCRRSDGWSSEMEMKSDPLDGSPIWRKREKEGRDGE